MSSLMYRQIAPTHSNSHSDEDKAYYYYDTLVKNGKKDEQGVNPTVKILFLNKKDQAIGIWEFPDTAQFDPKEVLLTAKKVNARSIVVGLTEPQDEESATEKANSLLHIFKKAGREFRIRLNDVLLLSKLGYNSYAENHII